MSGVGRSVMMAGGLLLTVFILLQIGLSIGDRFMTSDSLAINQTLNPEGYEAQQQLNEDFAGNTTFVMFLVFIVAAAVALYVVKSLGLF